WTLICGCWGWPWIDCGAFGFSNEKSLVYCASTRNCICPCGCWVGAAAGVSPPLPPLVEVAMVSVSGREGGRTESDDSTRLDREWDAIGVVRGSVWRCRGPRVG